MRDLEKARTLISNRGTSLKELSKVTGIPYPTLKHYSSEPNKLDNAKASRVNLLAKIYYEKEATRLRVASIISKKK